MIARSDIYVIVPAYQEASVIRKVVDELLSEKWPVIVVDDASTDGTSDCIRHLPIHLLRHPINLGQGAALQTGMQYARQLGAQAVVHFDADGQHQVGDMEALLQPIMRGEVDVVMGSRFLTEESKTSVPLRRRRLLKIAIGINALFTGLWLSDAHNGLRALNAKALARIHLRTNGMAHATEILSEIRKHQLRYCEVPVHIQYSDYAQQKGQRWHHALGILGDLILHKLLF
ncbi:MAG: glycosyltransferase family 2 protein [Bacteroidota bacterium]